MQDRTIQIFEMYHSDTLAYNSFEKPNNISVVVTTFPWGDGRLKVKEHSFIIVVVDLF